MSSPSSSSLPLPTRAFGDTGLRVSVLGFGAGHIGSDDLSDDDAGRLLHRALDLGVTLIDTARGYGRSEERIGRHLRERRSEVVLSSKGGYSVPGAEDWTPAALRGSLEDSLRRLQTDRLDIFHLHSPPLEVARRDDLLAVLHAAKREGLIRAAAYSGENETLAWAAQSGVFDSLQTSVNIADQWSLHHVLAGARRAGLGVIAKRPIANAAWRFESRPVGDYAETYWARLRELRLPLGLADQLPLAWDELALRFSAFAPCVDSVIVGTGRLANLERAAEVIGQGALPAALLSEIGTAWAMVGQGWPGEI